MIDSNFKIAVGTKVVDTIQAELNRSPKKTVKVTPILDDSGVVNGYKSLETYYTKGGEVVKITRELNKSGKDMGATLNSVAETNKKVGKSFYETTRHVDTLGSKFLDITKKVVAFGGVTAIIGMFTKAIGESYQAVKNMDDVMTEFNKVSDMSGESLSRYTDELTVMGESVARTGAEMLASSTEFVKAGYDEKQSAELAKVANLYMNIADGQVSSAEASALLVSQMKAFNMTADEATTVIDQINEVSNRFAVSSTDISTALTKSSSALATYGNTISESVSLVTAGSEIMTGQASKVSKGLRSIGANIVKLADDSGILEYSVNGMTKSLSLFDEQGRALSTFDVLSKVAQDWDKMTQAEQSSLALAQAGKTQIDVYTSVLSNFDTALKANETALSSQGSAMKENQAYMESMGAKLNLLKAQFEKLVLDGGVISKAIKAFLDLSIALLKIANTDIGGVTIGIGLVIGSFLLLSKTIDGLLTRFALLSVGIQKQAVDIAIANGATLGYAGSINMLTASFQKFTATLATNPIGLIAIGLTVAIVGMVTLHKHVTEVDTSLKDLHETTTGFKEELIELESSISAINSRLDEIKDKKLEITDQAQLDLLNQEQKALEQQLITAQELQKTKLQEASKSSVKALNTKVTYVDTSSSSETENVAMEVTRPQGLSMTIDAMKEYEGTLKTLQSEMANMEMKNQKDTSAYKEKASQVEELNKVIDAQKVAIPELTQQLSDEASQLDLSVDANKKLYAETQGVIDKSNEYMGVAEQKTTITEEDTEANENNADSVQEQIDAHQALMDSTSDVLSSMEMLNDASQEQAENGELSAETAMKLIEAGYAGALAYDAETNSVMLDREAMALLVQAKLENQIANLELANSGLADILINEGNAAVVSATGYNILALAKMDAMNAGASGVGNQFINNQKQIEVLNSKLDDLKTKGTGAFGAIGKSAGGASKSVQTLEDKVKSATNYMKTMIDKEIKALREAKEAEEERVEAEIDALKERREAQETYWDAKIEKVKKANEILEEQNKLQELEQNLALAKSKKVKVFTGEGFEYKEDVDAVSKASQELSDYKREQQIAKEVETLEKLKKKALANIDKQIKGWEKYKKEMQKNFDAQIKALEKYKDQLDDLTNGYKEQQDKLIAEQLLGAKLEQGNWQLRIDNLKKFVKEYNGELSSIKTDVDTKGTKKGESGSKAGMPSNIPKHASGSYAVPTDEIAIVGDSPNRELSIGSKLNMGGVMARLKGGTGVMPNTLTERLVSMAYNTNTSPTNNSNSSIININVDKVELPSVKDGKTFVDGLLGLKTLAIQTSS